MKVHASRVLNRSEDIEMYSKFALTARLRSQFLPAVPMHAENKQTNKQKNKQTHGLMGKRWVAPSKAAFVLFKAEEG